MAAAVKSTPIQAQSQDAAPQAIQENSESRRRRRPRDRAVRRPPSPLDVARDTGVRFFVIQNKFSAIRKRRVMNQPLPYEVNCSILFTELPLLERPEAAKRAGFNGVEFWWPFAEAMPADKDID